MKCYVYSIVNNISKQRYVGQTTNYYRRKEEHLSKLRENRHPNPKLQSAWNKYGEENFAFEKECFDISKKELDDKEKEYIKRYNSFINGYNLTEGGTGGNTKINRVLDFEKFCFAYFGNKKYEGMCNKTGKFLGVDSSTISALKREISYDDYRALALQLSENEKQKYVNDFEKAFNITSDNQPKAVKKKIDDELMVDILCMVSTYSRGIEKAILKKFHLSKGLVFHTIKYGEYQEAQKIFKNLSKTEVKARAIIKFQDYDIQDYSTYKLKIQYKDLYEKYK